MHCSTDSTKYFNLLQALSEIRKHRSCVILQVGDRRHATVVVGLSYYLLV
jgi:hypothetical protein